MKIKFSKIAALLFAGVVFLAPGCTDYQSDIEDIYQKIDKLAEKATVATLQDQANGLQTQLDALKAAHDADINALKADVASLKEADAALEKLMKANDEKLAADIAALDGDLKKVSSALDALTKDVKTYYEEFNALKQQIAAVLPTLATKEELNAKAEALQKQITDLQTTIAKEISDRAAADNALDAKISGEEAARKAADEAINAAIEALKTDLNNFKAEFVEYKAQVAGQIAGLDSRLTAAEAAVKKINEELIPAINAQIAACNERIDSTVEELDTYKQTTDNTIALMKQSIKALEEADVAINGRIDVLDNKVDTLAENVYAKFNDYVLTTTFEAYQKVVAAQLAAKVDTATYGAYVRANDKINADQTKRIEAVEAYVESLKEEIIPALEEADKALDKKIDDLATEVGTIKGQVEELTNRIATLEEQMNAALEEIEALNGRIDEMGDTMETMKQDIAALTQLIQSVVFVPDFDDCCATINYGVIDQGWGKAPLFTDAESVLTYKVYPQWAAAELAKIAAEDLSFFAMDVVPVERRGFFKDEEKVPALDIVKIEASDRTEGAFAVTVKGQNINDFYTGAQQYSSCFVIDYASNTKSVLTSGYNNWARNPLLVSLAGIANVDDETGKITALTEDDLFKEIPYTNTDVVKFLEDAEAVFSYNGELYTADQLAEATGIVIPVDYAIANREFSTDDNDVIALFVDNDVISENPEAEMPAVEEQLDPESTLAERQTAIGTIETITVTATVGGKTVEVYCSLTVTKEKATATASDIVINWGYKEDVAQDALAFAKEDYAYFRENLPIVVAESNFEEKGVEITDFVAPAAELVVKMVKAENDTTDVSEEYWDKIKVDIVDGEPVLSITGFEWDVTYIIEALYTLDYCDVTVNGKIQTIDREREAITLEYEPYEITYVKDLNKSAVYEIPFADSVWTKLPYACTIADNVTAEYFVKDNLQDNKPVDIKADHKRLNELYAPSDKPDTLILRTWITYKDATEPGIVDVNYTFFTYYGQEIDVIAPVKIVAPKFDLRHNEYYVFDDVNKGEHSDEYLYYSQVEPKWDPNIYTISHFDVEAVDLPSAFIIVDENKVNAEAAAAEASVEKWFEFDVEGSPKDAENITMSDDYKVFYHGFDVFTYVGGGLKIVNSDETEFFIPTTFDADHVAIYAEAEAATEADAVAGKYAGYGVHQYNPLILKLDENKKFEIGVNSADVYEQNAYEMVVLKDRRNEENLKEPLQYDLISGGAWVIGNNKNGFVSGVCAKDAYDIEEEITYEIDAEGISEDIINAISIDTKTGLVTFDYTGQKYLTQDVNFTITISFKHPWIEKPDSVTVNGRIYRK